MAEYEFDVPTSERGFMRRIVATMMEIFQMSHDEAVGRINAHWAGQEFRSAGKRMVLHHESPEWWAKTIAYGSDSYWWLDEENTQLRPYR